MGKRTVDDLLVLLVKLQKEENWRLLWVVGPLGCSLGSSEPALALGRLRNFPPRLPEEHPHALTTEIALAKAFAKQKMLTSRSEGFSL